MIGIRHYDVYPYEDDFVTVECAACGNPWPCAAATTQTSHQREVPQPEPPQST